MNLFQCSCTNATKFTLLHTDIYINYHSPKIDDVADNEKTSQKYIIIYYLYWITAKIKITLIHTMLYHLIIIIINIIITIYFAIRYAGWEGIVNADKYTSTSLCALRVAPFICTFIASALIIMLQIRCSMCINYSLLIWIIIVVACAKITSLYDDNKKKLKVIPIYVYNIMMMCAVDHDLHRYETIAICFFSFCFAALCQINEILVCFMCDNGNQRYTRIHLILLSASANHTHTINQFEWHISDSDLNLCRNITQSWRCE